MRIEGLKGSCNRLDPEKDTSFKDWLIDSVVREECQRSLTRTLEALIALGTEASRETAREVLRRCVERFNEPDQAGKPFMYTFEREELCGILDEIGGLCGLARDDERVDEWRES